MKIGVYGSAAGIMNDEIKVKAKEIGREIARKGHTIITGGCPGLPHEAILGAYEYGGKCIGYSPAVDLSSHKQSNYPTEGFSELIFVPKNYKHIDNPLVCKKYRNVSSVASIDAAVIISGRIGSMNEFTIAYDLGVNIGILEGSGGISNRAIKVLLTDIDKETGSKVIYEKDPIILLEKLIK
ncbi:MAG: hypothetical protein P1V18_05690 [Candidatus Gracilibacteria bacterium]|nr:hypothetical protein [Candidatus Gracilibacteria bacterium]